MDLKSKISVYGFGSYFMKKNKPNDIDLLLIHSDLSESSIADVIRLKKIMSKSNSKFDIVMLSRVEERHSNFIQKSKAIYIGEIYNDFHFNIISNKIQFYN